MNLMMIGFDDRQAAEQALDELEVATDQREVPLKDLAVVFQSRSGRSKVRQTSDAGAGPSLLRGGLLGLLVSVVLPAGAGAATMAGGALGGVIAAVGSSGVDNQMMRSLAASVSGNRGVVLALGEKPQFCTLHDVVGPYGDRIECLTVPEPTLTLIRELSKLSMEDLENG